MAEQEQRTAEIIRMQGLALLDAWNDLCDHTDELARVHAEYQRGMHSREEWDAYRETYCAERARTGKDSP